MDYQHVDVFAEGPFTGNSLTVFIADVGSPATGQMLAITREFRHFESIFLTPTAAEHRWRARVFDLMEELDFARRRVGASRPGRRQPTAGLGHRAAGQDRDRPDHS
jgi:predicted PhzF superfamily epimerase YddE/YHI9